MKNDINITKTNDGISINIKGDAKLDDIKALTKNCSDEKCDCDTEMMNKIDKISTNGKNGDINISLVGDNLKVEDIKGCMSGCDCGF